MGGDYFDPLQSIVEAAKAKKVHAVQDPSKMKRDHMSTVGKMVLDTSNRDPEPFLTTNQMFERDVDVPTGHGEYVPPNPYKSWTNFDIITGTKRPPIFKEDRSRFASVDPMSRSSAWDHPDMLHLPRAQQCSQHFLRSHNPFLPHADNPGGPVEWRSASKLVESKHRHERSQLSFAEKYERPVTAAQEMGWGVERNYKRGIFPKRDFHFGIQGSHITRFQQSMLLGPMNVANPAPSNHSSHAGIIG